MGIFERKWVLALIVLVGIIGFNGVSGWMASHDEISLDNSAPTAAPTENTEADASSAKEAAPATVTVHICGAVAQPGVFTLPAGSRINDVLEKAGGFTATADPVSINLAEVATDGQQIVIYEKSTEPQATGSSAKTAPKTVQSAASGLPVSINHGSLEALMELDGIGEKTAQKILDYRKAQGGFKNIEELKNVPGIGEKKFEAIKNDVRL